jgi:multidrug efflux pump subunit AcrA (membrane-fusion protein)
VPVARREGALVVPAAAVQSQGGISFVFVNENGVARRRDVTVGLRDQDRVEITAGLKAGDQVIASGSPAIADGTKIRAVGSGA